MKRPRVGSSRHHAGLDACVACGAAAGARCHRLTPDGRALQKTTRAWPHRGREPINETTKES